MNRKARRHPESCGIPTQQHSSPVPAFKNSKRPVDHGLSQKGKAKARESRRPG